MADIKKHMSRHLLSARHWITRAEESFAKEKDIRGELDLLLAKAELQHVQETNRSRQWRYKYPLLNHGLALGLSAMLAAIGFSGFYWWMHGREAAVVPIPLTVQQEAKYPVAHENIKADLQAPSNAQTAVLPAQVQPITSSEATSSTAVNPATPVTPPPTSPQTSESHEGSNLSARATNDKENILTPDEMKKVIRAAGKSLRGQ